MRFLVCWRLLLIRSKNAEACLITSWCYFWGCLGWPFLKIINLKQLLFHFSLIWKVRIFELGCAQRPRELLLKTKFMPLCQHVPVVPSVVASGVRDWFIVRRWILSCLLLKQHCNGERNVNYEVWHTCVICKSNPLHMLWHGARMGDFHCSLLPTKQKYSFPSGHTYLLSSMSLFAHKWLFAKRKQSWI